MKLSIAKRTLRGKTSPARGLVEQLGAVSRTGGAKGAGLISGASIVTRGEALGHGMYLDREFVAQTNAAFSAAGDRGIKSRFTHPGLSSDGLGKFLGRARAPRLADGGDRVVANLHLSPAARQSPDGDLAAYVLGLAEDDPTAFGTSIVFEHDRDAELAFFEQHGGRVIDLGEGFYEFDFAEFKSPDPQNTGNLFHARLKALKAVDVVDEPAANPAGMFSADPIFDDAEALLSFAFGLIDTPPALAQLDVEPRKVSVFVSKFLDRHQLTISKKGAAMADTNATSTTTTTAASSSAPPATPPVVTPPTTAASSKPAAATLDELQSACPGADADFILGQLKTGATLASAQSAFIAEQGKTIEQLGAKAKHLAETEPTAAKFSTDGATAGGGKRPADANAKLASIISIGPRAKK